MGIQPRLIFRRLIVVLTIFCGLGVVGVYSPLKMPTVSTTFAAATPTDSSLANQASLTKGNVSAAWQQGYQGQGMVVAVIDSGIQPHRDLTLSNPAAAKITRATVNRFIAEHGYGRYVSAKMPFAYDYVNHDNHHTNPDAQSSFHGEHVAGIIAANGSASQPNTQYVKGVAPQAQLLNMKVFGGFADEFPSDVSQAIYDAVALGANVINLSLGILVGNQSIVDQEQAAIHYAVDHGVVVTAATSNFGHAGSILADNNEDANSNQTTYEPINTGTTSNPAVSADAIAVGDENTALGAKSAMDPISGWGPTPQFDLKPDINAPGENIISTWQHNTLTSDSGTSMASPYVAGAAALVMQKLTQTQPSLHGRPLVAAVTAALMNAAQPMADSDYPGEIVSPRHQGAGQINVAHSLNLTGLATDANSGRGSVSLHSIGINTNFAIKVTNYGNTPQTYTIDSGTPATETRELKPTGIGIVHDMPLIGASLKASTDTIEIDPNQSKVINFNLNIADLTPSNRQVEGYVTFNTADASQTLRIPYYGYYGDPTAEQVIDKPANQSGSHFFGGYLLDDHNTPLGLSDRVSLASYVNAHPTVWDKLAAKITPKKVAFSPNGDGQADAITPYVFAKQNLANVKVQILNPAGHVIRIVDQETNTTKSFHENGNAYNNDLTLSASMRLAPKKFAWNGTVYQQSSGKMHPVADGRYTYQIKTTNFNSGQHQVQTFDLPVKVDTVAPTISKISYQNGILAAHYADRGVGFGRLSAMRLTINRGNTIGIGLKSSGQDNRGTIRFRLPQKQRQSLAKQGGRLQLALADAADNTISRTFKVKPAINQNLPVSTQSGSKSLWRQETRDLPVMQSREPYALTTRFTKTPGIHFKHLNDNSLSIINADNPAYNATNHTLQIDGQVKQAHSKLIILANPNEASAKNRVHLTRNGNFQFKLPLHSPSQRGIGYLLKQTIKHKTYSYRGTLEVITDTTLPALKLDQDDQATLNHQTGTYDVTTSQHQFTLSGTVDDNVDGYWLDINGNNLFHEQNNAGFNPLPSQTIANPHEAHHFSQTDNLRPGANYFTVVATDQAGNHVTKVFRVFKTN